MKIRSIYSALAGHYQSGSFQHVSITNLIFAAIIFQILIRVIGLIVVLVLVLVMIITVILDSKVRGSGLGDTFKHPDIKVACIDLQIHRYMHFSDMQI